MAYITGELKKDVVVNGVTYKAGSVASFPEQLGLEDYFKDFKMKDKLDENIKFEKTEVK